jgi:hypothetical protein
MVLNPRIKPLDFAAQQQHGTLRMIPFEDKTPEEERGRKEFREKPIDVFNDSLLSALRLSQGFKGVLRGGGAQTGDFELTGTLISLKTDESAFKLGFIPSTMKISATCTSSFRVANVRTGAVLLEETITTAGQGETRIFGGGQYVQYDPTFGYEESISQAIGENVSLITKRLHEVLPKLQ